ncbi:mandelate racemase/muconate lactonizing enzyme family protein [Oryzobacter sp. R7]|uniref:mandelate racemase/muconate lactonizing enzyme family protein n=1 Tax=Oryzobacter faecalis TaxID=3388656 RepID=UPI00398CB6C7
MRITRITALAVKSETAYAMSGAVRPGERLPGSDYRRFAPHRQLYSDRSEALLVRVETDAGLVGWGEAQAPIGPEVVMTVVERVLGPTLLGTDPLATTARGIDMYETLRVRGQVGGFQLDAIAALDTALWDLRGRVAGLSIAELAGGRLRDRLPCYVTGLRETSPEGRREEAAEWARRGFGVKPCLGFGVGPDAAEVVGLRDAMGADAWLAVDGMWGYTLPQAKQLARVLAEADVAFFESPLAPEDVLGHRDLVQAVDVTVAVGEPLRTRFQFADWLGRRAMGLAQPDLMRNGVTESLAIAALASAHHVPVALHTGVVTAVGMAASWQVAASLPNFAVQEFQPVMLETFGGLVDGSLTVESGVVVVPEGPGLGVDVDDERVRAMASAEVEIRL